MVAPEGHRWLRVADPGRACPLDPSFAARSGGRWNPPGSWPTLYLNRDVVTARAQVVRLCDGAPFQVEDLTDDAFVLVSAVLPERQRVADVVGVEGVRSVGLAATYPLDSRGRITPWQRCQAVGRRAERDGLDGIEARSAAVADGSGRELAWFSRGRAATAVGRPRPFGEWRL